MLSMGLELPCDTADSFRSTGHFARALQVNVSKVLCSCAAMDWAIIPPPKTRPEIVLDLVWDHKCRRLATGVKSERGMPGFEQTT